MLSPDGATLAYSSAAENSIHILDAKSGEEIWLLEGHTAPVTTLALSSDGKLLASSNAPYGDVSDGSLRIWNVETGEQMAQIATPGTYNLVFSPDGRMLAGYQNLVKGFVLWDVETQTELITIPDLFGLASFNLDGAQVASGSEDGNLVRIVNTTTGEEVRALDAHSTQVWTTAASLDGTQLASGSEDGMIVIWDFATGEQINTLRGSHKGNINSLAFNPDNSILASLGSGVV